jgi:hypothetical protein
MEDIGGFFLFCAVVFGPIAGVVLAINAIVHACG